MIVVLADDISGAAELAGIACALGLSAEVHTQFDANSTARVIAVDSDTRSLSAVEAAKRVTNIASRIVSAKPEWIYKKTDSVLRGNIQAEITSLLGITSKRQALFIPANPSRQRIINGGQYFIEGQPLHESVFATDPEYPARNCDVRLLLERMSGVPIFVLGSKASQPDGNGIIVPDVTSTEGLKRHAMNVRDETLCAGAAEFFRALLEARTGANEVSTVTSFRLPESPMIFVCGSIAAWPVRRDQCLRAGIPIHEMSLQGARSLTWLDKFSQDLRKHQRALIAIGEPALARQIPTTQLVGLFASAVKKVIDAGPLKTILLEGGATAIAVLRAMEWQRLVAVTPFGAGIPALQVHGCDQLVLGIKPGSYPWPAEWWGHTNR